MSGPRTALGHYFAQLALIAGLLVVLAVLKVEDELFAWQHRGEP